MKYEKLRIIYCEYFQDKIKSSKEYKNKFNKAVEYEKKYMDRFSKEDKDIIENMIYNFILAENQMLEDTFIYAVKYAYELFSEIK